VREIPNVACAAILALSVVACSSPRTLPIEVITGYEKDTFSADPKVLRVDITVTLLDGSTLEASAEPGGTFEIGDVSEDEYITVDVAGVAESGATVVRGRSLSGILLSSAPSAIPVFAQRLDQWSRPPGGFTRTHVAGPAGVVGERYLLLGGAEGADDPAAVEHYDLLAYGGATVVEAFPRAPRTIVSLGDAVVAIDDEGATLIDYSERSYTEIDLPDGLPSFADVAGGVPISNGNGVTYVVGATRRSDPPTTAVLAVSDDGTLEAFSLVQPRKGAAAAWIDGVGLVVAGGSATGAGVELLPQGGLAFSVRSFPSDPVEGAGAVIDPPHSMALIGGHAAGVPAVTRRFDPTCSNECEVIEVPDASLDTPLERMAAYSLGGVRTVVIGDEVGGDGLTRAFIVDLGGKVIDVPLREPRRGATAIPTPHGLLALIGGMHPDDTPALTVELFFPE
jgi:hypothetical protein